MSEITPKEMIDDIESGLQAGLVQLNDWEANFIDDFLQGKEVKSEKQRAVIKKIWNRIDA